MAATGLALIAILCGFAMSVMPLLSTAGKMAAVIAAAGFSVTLFASLLPQWRSHMRTSNDDSNRGETSGQTSTRQAA